MSEGVAVAEPHWWSGYTSDSFLDRAVAGSLGFVNTVGRDLDSVGAGIGWLGEKGARGLASVGVVSESTVDGIGARRREAVARSEASHDAVDAAYAGSTSYTVGGYAGSAAEVVGMELASGGLATGAAASLTAVRGSRAVAALARAVPGASKGSHAVAAAESALARGAASHVAEGVGGVAEGMEGGAVKAAASTAERSAVEGAGDSLGKAAEASASGKGRGMSIVGSVGRSLWGFTKGASRFSGRAAVGGTKAAARGAVGAAANFVGGATYGVAEGLGNSVGGTVGMFAKFLALYEAYKLFVSYLRGSDGSALGEGSHTSAAVAKANAEKAKGDLTAALDPRSAAVAGPGAAGMAAVDRFGSVASAPVPTGTLDAAKREAYGMGRIQPAGTMNYDQSASVTTFANGKPTTTVLPYLRGTGDGDTLQRSAEWWNGQSKLGLVPPIAEGSMITVGQGRTARSYSVKDGEFRNVSVELGKSLPGNARELSPADLGRASVVPGLSSAGLLAVGLGGSDAKAFDETTRGRVFASVDPDGSRRVTGMEAAADGRGRSVFSVAVNKDGVGAMSATRFSKAGSMDVEDTTTQGVGRSMTVDSSGRIASDRSVLEKAGAVGRSVGGDDLVRSLGLRDGSAKVERSAGDAGEPGKAAVDFQGHDRGGFLVRGGMSVENGKATFKVFGADGKTPTWSKSVEDGGFSVGPDGKVALSGRAKEISEGFLKDPRGEAREMEGLGREGGAMDRMVSAESDRDLPAGIGGMSPALARGQDRRSAGMER